MWLGTRSSGSWDSWKNIENLKKKIRSDLLKPGYIGNTMANTSYPTKSRPTGMICKLSFMVRKVIPIEW